LNSNAYGESPEKLIKTLDIPLGQEAEKQS